MPKPGFGHPEAIGPCPEDLDDSLWNPWRSNDPNAPKGHGTPVAALAAGRTFGIAPQAGIYSIKVLQCGWKRCANGQIEIVQMGITHRALRAATDQIEKVVKQRNLQGKAVVNLSWGKSLSPVIHSRR